MSELQGAVAAAQLPKLKDIVTRRRATADQLTEKIKNLPGITTPEIDRRNLHSYWKYCLSVDSQIVADGAVGLAKALKEEKGIFSAPRYIQKPAFQCEIFREQRTFGNSRFPFTLARPEAVDYRPEQFPGTFAGLESVLVLPWNENYTEEHVDYIANAIEQVLS